MPTTANPCMRGEDEKPKDTREILFFEYNITTCSFDLYEGGGDRYLCVNGQTDKIEGNRSPNEKLYMLYPVAQVKPINMTNKNHPEYRGLKEGIKLAMEQFVERFSTLPRDFVFSMRNMRNYDFLLWPH